MCDRLIFLQRCDRFFSLERCDRLTFLQRCGRFMMLCQVSLPLAAFTFSHTATVSVKFAMALVGITYVVFYESLHVDT